MTIELDKALTVGVDSHDHRRLTGFRVWMRPARSVWPYTQIAGDDVDWVDRRFDWATDLALATARVFDSREAAEEWSVDLADRVSIFPAAYVPPAANVASAHAVRQATIE